MRKLFQTFIFAISVFVAPWLSAASLQSGNKAPELQVSVWVKGDPVQLALPRDVTQEVYFVVLFWGSWSDLSVSYLPQYSFLRNKYEKSGFIFAAVNRDSVQKQEAFFKKHPDINFSAGVDDDSKTSNAYLDVTTILPMVYVINSKQKILWCGEIYEVEGVLDSLLNGKFDLDDQKKLSILRRELQNAIQSGVDASICSLVNKIFEIDKRNNFALRSRLFYYEKNNRYPEALAFIDERISKDPEFVQLYFVRLELMVRSQKTTPLEYEQWIELIFSKYSSDPEQMNELAWFAMDSIPFGYADPSQIMKCAQKAVDGLTPETPKNKRGLYLNTMARALYMQGRFEEAVKNQTESLENLKGTPMAEKTAIILNFYKKLLPPAN